MHNQTPSNWIINVPKAAIPQGLHYAIVEGRDVLIQIVDPCTEFPLPRYNFGKVYQFEFLDEENDEPFSITRSQAKEIANILRFAKNSGRNVVVHCHAGLCRSGAVTEAGVMIGFTDPEVPRLPNMRVLNFLKEELGLSYDPNYSPFNNMEFEREDGDV